MQLFGNILRRFGIETTYVSPTDLAAWRAAVQPNTKLLFVETPSNPLTEICDIAALARSPGRPAHCWRSTTASARRSCNGRWSWAPTSSFTPPPSIWTGRAGCWAARCSAARKSIDPVYTFLRTAGPTMSAFNAWVFLKGLETLSLRMEAHSRSALELAQWLEQQPQVERVFYPGLPSHPQHALAMQQQKTGGGIVAFEVKGGKDAAWRVVDATRMISITANLGDTKTTITHPATTTHSRMTPEQRAAAGIGDGLVRVAVGLESVADIQADLARGLK